MPHEPPKSGGWLIPWDLSVCRQERNTLGLGREGATLAPQNPPNTGREQAGDSMLHPGAPEKA